MARINPLLEFDNSLPTGMSTCHEIGISGWCKSNCYLCAAYEIDDMTDEYIISLVGKEKQEMMLKEFKEQL